MSTRVQKGGTIFKPVANTRSHTTLSRASATPESQSSKSQGDNRRDIQSGAAPRFVVVPSLPASAPNAQLSSQPRAAQEVFDFSEPNTQVSAEIDSLAVSHTQTVPGGLSTQLNPPSQLLALPIQPSPATDPSSTQRQADVSQLAEELDIDHDPTPRPSMPPPLLVVSRVPPPAPPPELNSAPPQMSRSNSSPQALWLPLQIQPNHNIPATAQFLSASNGLPDSNVTQALNSENNFPFDFSILAGQAAQAATGLHGMSGLQLNGIGVIESRPGPQQNPKKPTSATGDISTEQPNSLRAKTLTSSGQSMEYGVDDSPQVDISSHPPTQPRKKRARKPTNDSTDFGSGTPPTKKPSRNSSGSGRSRGSSVPALNPDADPGDDLDPTLVTMATICEDTGQGRVSSKAAQILDNHAAWKRSNKEKRTRMRALMEAKKYGRSEDTDERSAPPPTVEPSPSEATTSTAETPGRHTSNPPGSPTQNDVSENGFDFDYNNSMATSRFNVQVRIGPSGETIVDEESLFVDRAEEHETDNYIHVEESDATKFVNSGSYSKKFRGTRWTAEETELFYAALSQFGENYELMSYVLPGRDRKACKAKFKTEDKKNPQRINYCLNNRVPYGELQPLHTYPWKRVRFQTCKHSPE
ncbi:hypothetical protein BJV78DRAFT_1160673 [Lactifluus subvellereus]|nr:hypothetical protein BJV78DRAFT_1160673 [Lactifluus subvellereus]